MGLVEPPKGIEPARLFRALARAEGPLWTLSYRAPEAPHIPLFVRGLRGEELHDVRDVARDSSAPVLAEAMALVPLALCTSEGAPLMSSNDFGMLTESSAVALTQAVYEALNIVSPSFDAIDHKAWMRVLDKGAAANVPIALRMHGTCDFVVGAHVVRIGRPDRYWGKPPALLTDGQVLVYRAAKAYIERVCP
jgi:hypothetical protein